MIGGRELRLAVALGLACSLVYAQTPKPFPQPTQPPQPPSAPAPPNPGRPVPPATPPARVPPSPASDAPTEAMLGAPIYPGAQFITSYDAGRGQRFYLFGVGAGFLEL